MEVSLTPELERWVAERVATGEFESASAAVRAGLLLLRRKEDEDRAKLEALRRDIQEGLDQADRGDLLPGDEVFRRACERIAAVSLAPEMERWIAERVADGRFETESAAVSDGLLLLHGEEERRIKVEALRRDVRGALGQLDRGEWIDGEEAFSGVLNWIAQPQEKTA
jgi:antitoxin ParD1/3/4